MELGGNGREKVEAPCPRCGAALEADGACPSCRPPEVARAPGPPDFGRPVRLLACGACATRFAFDAALGAASRCPLCGAAALAAAEFPGAGPARAAPFTIELARAQASFHRWLRRLRFRPPEFVRLARSRGLRGLYLPLWTVNAGLRSRFSAEVPTGPAGLATNDGDAAPRRWKLVEGERFDRFAESWPAIRLPGEAPAGPPADGGLVEWTPDYLDGLAAVVAPASPEEAWQTLREALHERARRACAAEVGPEHRALRVETTEELADVAPALVPVYVAAIPWRGRVHHFVIDGRTGKAHGEAPYSAGRLVAAMAAAVLAVAAMGTLLAGEPAPPHPPAAPTALP